MSAITPELRSRTEALKTQYDELTEAIARRKQAGLQTGDLVRKQRDIRDEAKRILQSKMEVEHAATDLMTLREAPASKRRRVTFSEDTKPMGGRSRRRRRRRGRRTRRCRRHRRN